MNERERLERDFRRAMQTSRMALDEAEGHLDDLHAMGVDTDDLENEEASR